jgi:hypothetical protein
VVCDSVVSLKLIYSLSDLHKFVVCESVVLLNLIYSSSD